MHKYVLAMSHCSGRRLNGDQACVQMAAIAILIRCRQPGYVQTAPARKQQVRRRTSEPACCRRPNLTCPSALPLTRVASQSTLGEDDGGSGTYILSSAVVRERHPQRQTSSALPDWQCNAPSRTVVRPYQPSANGRRRLPND